MKESFRVLILGILFTGIGNILINSDIDSILIDILGGCFCFSGGWILYDATKVAYNAGLKQGWIDSAGLQE